MAVALGIVRTQMKRWKEYDWGDTLFQFTWEELWHTPFYNNKMHLTSKTRNNAWIQDLSIPK